MFRKMSLTLKLAVVIGSILIIAFAGLLACSVVMSGSAISKGVSGELTSISKNNSDLIQQSFDILEKAASGIQTYLEWGYERAIQNPEDNIVPSDPEIANILLSELYTGKPLSISAHDAEVFMTEMCRTTIKENDTITAMGVMFEPYKFENDMQVYGFWIDKNNVDGKLEPYTSYQDYAKEDSYKYVVENKRAYISQPYEDGSGELLLAYGVPIMHGSELLGVVIANINLDTFSTVTTSSENYPTLWTTIYDHNGNIVWDSETHEDIGRNVREFTPKEEELQTIQSFMAGTSRFEQEKTREDGKKVSCFYTPIQVGDQIWWSMTGLYADDAQRLVTQTAGWLLALSFIALVVIVVSIIITLRRTISPVKTIVAAMDNIVQGNLDIQIEAKNEDEIGKLAKAFQMMASNMKEIISDVDYILNEMANGNFNVRTRAEESYVGEYKSILMAIRRINFGLSETLAQIGASASEVASGSEQVSNGAQALSQGATEQASSIQELAATVTELSTTVNSNSEIVSEANSNANRVNGKIRESGRRMHDTLELMEEIRSSANETQRIIKTIEDIAFQTNILALNAAVEAARAGVAGKGFAVVADEVRNLAAKSAEASKATSELLNNALNAIEKGSLSMVETQQFVDDVVLEAEEITKVFQQIAEASDSQAVSLGQVTQGIDQISAVVQTNSATAEEGAASSEELMGQARLLETLVKKFQLRDTVAQGGSTGESQTQEESKEDFYLDPTMKY